MEEIRDSVYYQQLARVARIKAAETDDAYLARRLKEAAIKHERTARRLKADEDARGK